jgi:hypothetical protein
MRKSVRSHGKTFWVVVDCSASALIVSQKSH